jgi:hypothetical protein
MVISPVVCARSNTAEAPSLEAPREARELGSSPRIEEAGDNKLREGIFIGDDK